jgi:hypothetical protein
MIVVVLTSVLNRTVHKLETKVEVQKNKLDDQEEIIRQLVVYSMSSMIYTHLRHLRDGRISRSEGRPYEYHYRNNPPFQREMYYLRDNGFIQPVGQGYLDFNEFIDGKDLIDMAKPTPIGEYYVKLREEYETKALEKT